MVGKDIKIGARCINAMAETVATKPAFRDAFARGQRCIVPVDAFYEWKKTPSGKQPYAIVGTDGLPLAMAGLWERWKDRDTGDTVQTFTIITTVPNELCGAIHNRMPVILPREKWPTVGRARGGSGRVALDDPTPVPGGIYARLSGRRARGERAEQRCRVAR